MSIAIRTIEEQTPVVPLGTQNVSGEYLHRVISCRHNRTVYEVQVWKKIVGCGHCGAAGSLDGSQEFGVRCLLCGWDSVTESMKLQAKENNTSENVNPDRDNRRATNHDEPSGGKRRHRKSRTSANLLKGHEPESGHPWKRYGNKDGY